MAVGTLIDKIDKYIGGWILRPKLNVKETRVRALGDMHEEVRPASYQILVKNEGRSTARNCKPRVRFYGIRGEDTDNPNSEFEVDSQVCWAQADSPSSIDLHQDEESWVEVFRLIEDYRSREDFDPEDDGWIEFPSTRGYEEPADIMFRDDRGVELAEDKLRRPVVHQTRWLSASLKITAENTTLDYKINFVDINERLGASIAFTDEQID